MRTINIGSRESALAVAQARIVIDALRRARPDMRFEPVTMKTTGDKITDRPLDAVGGKGLFTKELDDALRDGRIDLAVHSYKDLPTPTPPDLPVVATPKREDPRDVLVLPAGATTIAKDKPIGTSSPRRRLRIAKIFPEHACAPVRGNIQTRLQKLDNGEFAALVLAAAGLKRLNLRNRIHRFFEPEEILPAACQGILAVQARAGEEHPYLAAIHDPETYDAATAERAFLETLGATCTSPVAAYARMNDDRILTLSTWHVDENGEHSTNA